MSDPIVLTDAPVPTTADLALEDALTAAEWSWIGRQARKTARAQGTSKYVPHQGARERARRLAKA